MQERDGLDPMVELVAIADCLPPAALKLVGGPAPVSSMTWILNVLGPAPRTEDGWWLLRANADYASAGSSSQQMGIWNATGEPIAEQMQSVAIFG
jgi:acyl-CoA thioesterase